jgi:hypothetical protein
MELIRPPLVVAFELSENTIDRDQQKETARKE